MLVSFKELSPITRYTNPDFQNSKDGLMWDPTFLPLYAQARSLSLEVDQIRYDPAAAALKTLEAGLDKAITSALDLAYSNWGWDLLWGRSAARAARLYSALQTAKSNVKKYVSDVGSALSKARAAIAARVQAQEDAKKAAEEAKAQEEAAKAAAAAAEAARQAAATASTQQEIIQAQLAQARAEAELAKLNAPKIFGLPASLVIGGGAVIALGAGAWLLKHKKR